MRRALLVGLIGSIVAVLVVTAVVLAPEQDPVVSVPVAPEPEANAPEEGVAVARVRVLDLQGQPLARMAPIVTRQPNAFDPPIAQGPVTGADGRSWVSYDGSKSVCIRAWDPTLAFFANNYYDIPENPGGQTPELDVVMVPAAAFGCVVHTPDGALLHDAEIELLMSHPAKGPWWPASATTNDAGRVAFDRIPAGEYILMLNTKLNGRADLGTVALRPGSFSDLGEVTLR
jgi:hypothetical protein